MKFRYTMIFLLSISYIFGQGNFIEPVSGFSIKKNSVINLKTGEQIVGKVKSTKFKGFYITDVVIKVDDEKIKINASKIASMYLAQSKLSKIVSVANEATDINKVIKDDRFSNDKSDLLIEGFSYYESQEIMLSKNKRIYALLFLMNPGFCEKIKVYNYVTGSNGRDYITLNKKTLKPGFVPNVRSDSYLIKKENETVYKLSIRDFYKDPEIIFDNCKDAKGEGDYHWLKLDKHIFNYTTKCN